MDELIDYLLQLAASFGIIVRSIHEPPDFPSMSFHKSQKMLINMNWRNQWEIPFIIGHEMGHLVNGDVGTWEYQSAPSSVGTQEHRADMYALKLIYNYAMQQMEPPIEPCDFMHQFGIPDWMYDDTMAIFEKSRC